MIFMIFISIHSVIICVVFSGAYMRCTRLCSLNPGATVQECCWHTSVLIFYKTGHLLLCKLGLSIFVGAHNITLGYRQTDSSLPKRYT
jgi:hypothetical protein